MRRLVWLVSLLVAVDTLLYAALTPLLPHFQHELGLQSTWFSVRGAAAGRAPRAVRGWIVVVASSPGSAPRPPGHVLRSDDHAGLRPGYWVAYRGPYATRVEAQASAGTGYVRRLAP